jgi:hypothetical protein
MANRTRSIIVSMRHAMAASHALVAKPGKDFTFASRPGLADFEDGPFGFRKFDWGLNWGLDLGLFLGGRFVPHCWAAARKDGMGTRPKVIGQAGRGAYFKMT